MSENLAGIIPVAGHASDISLPWHHVLMPYDKNKTLLQHAVYNCAMAGCSTIWIVCGEDQQPLVRSLIGEKVEDPVYRYRAHARHASDHKRFIPVFYCAIPARDLQLRNHIGWTAIFGSLLAKKIFGGLSKHTAPAHFFVCWPYSVINSDVIRPLRKQLQKDSIVFADAQHSIFTEDFLPFVCSMEIIKELQKHCYDLQSPTANLGPFADLELSHLLSPLRAVGIHRTEFNYKKVSNWHEYCNYFK